MSQIKVELQEFMGSDRAIAEAAWTSSLSLEAKERRSDADVERIVNILADSGHSTPFESVVLRFWIKMPISTDRQHMTHRIASHNGMSGRYRTMPDEWLDPPDDIMRFTGQNYSLSCFIDEYERLCQAANEWYRKTLAQLKEDETRGWITNADYKRLREFFRGVLPQNNMTERTTIFNLRSFANYQRLRNDSHAQPEIQEVARQMLKAVEDSKVAPLALAALKRNGWRI